MPIKHIAVDLDNCLAKSTMAPDWKIGEANPIILEKVMGLLSVGRPVKIFTARASDPNQIPIVKQWLLDHGLPDLEVTNVKDFDTLEIWDDRARQVDPRTGDFVASKPSEASPIQIEIAVAMGHADKVNEVYGIESLPMADTVVEKKKDAKAESNLKALEKAEKTGKVKPVASTEYVKYVSKPDARPEHKALNGKIMRADSIAARSVTPPADKHCRCKVVPVDTPTKLVTNQIQDDYYHQKEEKKAMSDMKAFADAADKSVSGRDDFVQFLPTIGHLSPEEQRNQINKYIDARKNKIAELSNARLKERSTSKVDKINKDIEYQSSQMSEGKAALANIKDKKEQTKEVKKIAEKQSANLTDAQKSAAAALSKISVNGLRNDQELIKQYENLDATWNKLNANPKTTDKEYRDLMITAGRVAKASQDNLAKEMKVVAQNLKDDSSAREKQEAVDRFNGITDKATQISVLLSKGGDKISSLTGKTPSSVLKEIVESKQLTSQQLAEVQKAMANPKATPASISNTIQTHIDNNAKVNEKLGDISGEIPDSVKTRLAKNPESDSVDKLKKDYALAQGNLEKVRQKAEGYNLTPEQEKDFIRKSLEAKAAPGDYKAKADAIKSRIDTLQATPVKTGPQAKDKAAAIDALKKQHAQVMAQAGKYFNLSPQQAALEYKKAGERDAKVAELVKGGLNQKQAEEAYALGYTKKDGAAVDQSIASYQKEMEGKQHESSAGFEAALNQPVKRVTPAQQQKVANVNMVNKGGQVQGAADRAETKLVADNSKPEPGSSMKPKVGTYLPGTPEKKSEEYLTDEQKSVAQRIYNGSENKDIAYRVMNAFRAGQSVADVMKNPEIAKAFEEGSKRGSVASAEEQPQEEKKEVAKDESAPEVKEVATGKDDKKPVEQPIEEPKQDVVDEDLRAKYKDARSDAEKNARKWTDAETARYAAERARSEVGQRVANAVESKSQPPAPKPSEPAKAPVIPERDAAYGVTSAGNLDIESPYSKHLMRSAANTLSPQQLADRKRLIEEEKKFGAGQYAAKMANLAADVQDVATSPGQAVLKGLEKVAQHTQNPEKDVNAIKQAASNLDNSLRRNITSKMQHPAKLAEVPHPKQEDYAGVKQAANAVTEPIVNTASKLNESLSSNITSKMQNPTKLAGVEKPKAEDYTGVRQAANAIAEPAKKTIDKFEAQAAKLDQPLNLPSVQTVLDKYRAPLPQTPDVNIPEMLKNDAKSIAQGTTSAAQGLGKAVESAVSPIAKGAQWVGEKLNPPKAQQQAVTPPPPPAETTSTNVEVTQNQGDKPVETVLTEQTESVPQEKKEEEDSKTVATNEFCDSCQDNPTKVVMVRIEKEDGDTIANQMGVNPLDRYKPTEDGKGYMVPMADKGGKCSGSCVKQVGSDWRVVSNKTGKLWPAKYDTEEKAKAALAAFHIG